MSTLNIVYEDDNIIVVDKPAGLIVEGGKAGEPDLDSECRKYLKSRGEKPEIYVVHRLDKPVSGLIVLAKDAGSAAELSKQIQDKTMKKQYEARVFVTKDYPDEAMLTDYLVKDPMNNVSRVAGKTSKGAKEAVLSYKAVSHEDKTAVLRVDLMTGRHHQIRVQLSNAGLPLLGDQKYGNAESIEYSRKNGIKDVALKAVGLSFVHPVSGQKLEFKL